MTSRGMDKLILELAEDWKPVKRLPHPFARIAPWLTLTLAYIWLATGIPGLRADIHEKMIEPGFVFELGLVFIMGVTAALSASWLCVPDMRGLKSMPAVPITLLTVFLLWEGALLLKYGVNPVEEPRICLIGGVVFSFFPALAMILITRHGATTRPGLLAFMAVLSVSSFGYIALRLVCFIDAPGHILFWHCIPFAVLGILMGSVARRLYRW